MKLIFFLSCVCIQLGMHAQELYVFSEPASNIPAKTFAFRLNGKIMRNAQGTSFNRIMPEIKYGIHKRWMVAAAMTASNMYSSDYAFESVSAYVKHRFLSTDKPHHHYRAAWYGGVSHASNNRMVQEINPEGDHSAYYAGIVNTLLVHKLALSAGADYLQYTGKYPVMPAAHHVHEVIYYPESLFRYNISAGFLTLPIKYKNYKQPNVNLYAELLGKTDLKGTYLLDFAPSLQLILQSQWRIDLGYRYQLEGNMRRMNSDMFLLRLEYQWFNAVK